MPAQDPTNKTMGSTTLAPATYHFKRRDDLMEAARAIKESGRQSPSSVAVMQDYIRLARVHNVTARMFRKQVQEEAR